MTRVALDASALLAMLLGEPGGEKVKAALDDALLCAVNLAEIVSHYAKLGASRPDMSARRQRGKRFATSARRSWPQPSGICSSDTTMS